ncbi:uncharacterized protein isoform X2 [Choristoneura fumiferana]|uniref:uncharacterized protein isoform X2 n=1 Tax=Choristoneura fumiferana TaxID=7141 RepID=UPI003D157A05
MIQKWKTILTNWVNCYSCDNEKRQQNITLDNLLHLFTHIQENLKLDNSKSSNFEAGTLQVFIKEKYPEFKFENGNLEATNEDEVYTLASLLLFFVCVNSKNDDIKRVMCNKLSVEDQETILKFSKCLMDCSTILYTDVEAAIAEACGPQTGSQVAETPPALRSLHGEVRRLQAALDAERFDRNYLQDELARTQLKLDRLSKEKEQYKLEILNLKAKISLCCGEDREASSQARADDTRLQKQLQELEARLDSVQGRLDDVEDERDAYKKKLEDLKHERDKWLSLSQQESFRAGQLTDQLETERRTVQSLKDLVSELRQHNRNNGLDASMLECDDPDTSIQSLHNISVCSEACANVVEVQLGEERAKIEVLKQQMQGLQDQLAEVNQKLESEKLTFEKILSEKEQDVFSLKHRINEEIEDKNNLKTHYDQEIEKLNDKISKLTQTITDNKESTKLALEEKLHEMQSLQQHLAEETKKSGNIIKNLKIELEAEKFAQLKLKDDCDNRIMKLNEKILNRNNELVELQNNIIKKSEMIEVIQADLRKEKELRDELSNSCNNQLFKLNEQRIAIENSIREKCHEISEYQKHLQKNEQCVEELNKTVAHLQSTVLSLEEKCQHKDGKIVAKQKEIEFLNDVYQKEQEKLTHKIDERNATIKSLQMQLQNEIEYKVQLKNELAQLQTSKMSLVEEVNDVKTKSKADLLEKENTLDAIYGHLKEETKLKEDLIVLCEKREHELRQLEEEVSNKEHRIQLLKKQMDSETKLLKDEIMTKEEMIESINQIILIEQKEKSDLQETLNNSNDEKARLEAAVIEKDNDLSKLKNAYEKLCRDHHDNKQNLKTLEAKLKDEAKKNEQLQDSNEKNTSKLLLKLEKTEKSIKKIQLQSKSILDSKELQVQSLTLELSDLKAAIECEREMVTVAKKEKEALEETLNNEVYFKNRLEAEYQKKCKILEDTITNFKEEIASKNKEIEKITVTITKLKNTCAELKNSVESEKAATVEMKEEYEKHVLELSEKELNSKKELSDKSAKIDHMLSDLKQEKELKDELSILYHKNLTKLEEEKSKIDSEFQQQVYENKILQKEIEENVALVEELQSEVASMKTLAASVEQECSNLKETNDNLLKEVETRSIEMEQNHKMLQDSNKELSENNEKLNLALDERNIIVDSIQTQLQHEIELRVQYETKIIELQSTNNEFEGKNTALSSKIVQLTNEISQKNEELLVIKKYLEEKVNTIELLTTEVERITKDYAVSTNTLSVVQNDNIKLLSDNDAHNRVIEELRNNILNLERKISAEKETLCNQITETNNISTNLNIEIENKIRLENEIAEFKAKNMEFLDTNNKLTREILEMNHIVNEKDNKIKELENEIEEEKTRTEKIIYDCDIKDAELNKISEQVVLKNNELKNLNVHIQHAIGIQEEQVLEKDDIIKAVQNKLKSELSEKENLQSALESLNKINANLMADIKEKCEELCEVQVKYDDLCEKSRKNECSYQSEKQSYDCILAAKENELLYLKNSLATEIDQKTYYDEQTVTLNKTIKELQEMQSKEQQIIDDKIKLENTIKNLEIEVDAEKISKMKLKEDNENIVSKLNKKITNISNELLQLQNNVIENNKKTELLLCDYNKEKESKDALLKKCDEEIIKLNETKVILEKESQQKMQEFRKLQESVEEKNISIEQLHKEIDDLRNYCTELQKDKRILEEAKMALITVVDERDKKILEFENAETVLATIVNNLESQLKGVTNKLQNRKDTSETTENKLQSEISTNTNLKNNLDSLQEDLSGKLKEIIQLQEENEQLHKITSETKTTVEGLQAELKEKSMKINQLIESSEAETSKLNSLVQSLRQEIKKKDLEIQQLETIREKLHEDLTKQKDSLITAQKEIEILENKYNEEYKLKEKFRKECENQRVMLNGITEKLNQNVIVQNNEAMEMTKEIQSLRKAVEQKCEELRIAEENICIQTKAIADLTTTKETEIENLNKKVGSLQSLNTDLDQELKNEADRKMQIIEALQKDNEQLQYIIEEENSTHEIMLKEKDKFIEELDEKLKYVNIQLEDIRRDYEDKTLMWEKLKIDAEEKIQVYEAKIEKLEEEKTRLMKEIEALKETLAESKQEKCVESKHTTWEKDTHGLQNQKELFHEEMGRLKLKQSEEIAALERELVKSREKLAESSRAYEEHIRALTTELWSVGEKFLVKKEEADWLRKKQSGSLMSLQHVHSSGLHAPRDSEVIGRPSDTISLRSLPMHNKQKTESRGLHMSDEEGEVFDNRFLKELSATPRASLAPGQRISELKRRNSLVPPHLKSSYPAEMQFAPIVDEEEIKCASNSTFSMGRQQRKEVGITAYKKPGPPTPSKQAGRLSATDGELRESLRVEADPHAGRKTSTPSRIRSLFRSHKNDVDEGTPRSRRFSSIFRKK